MSVQQFMLGRELPCTVMELLAVRPAALPGATHDALRQRVESGQNYPDVLYRLGLSHLGRQELGLARQRLTQAVTQKPDFDPARLALAAVADLLAAHCEALDQIDAVLANATAGADAATDAASIDRSTPASAMRTAHAPAAASTGPSRYALLCAAGFCLERVGTPGAAAYRYEEALSALAAGAHDSHEAADLFAHHRLAAIYLSHNQLEESVRHHKAILDAEPQEQAVRTSLAHLLQLLGRHKEAVWEYQKALCLDPDSWDLQQALADQFERMGDSDAAIHHLRGLVKKNPSFPDLHLRLANLYSTRGQDRDATEEFSAALAVHPDYIDCHISLARHELGMGRMQAAANHFQRAATLNDHNVEAYAGLAVALHRLGKADEAREMLVSATKIAGNSDVLVAQLGLLELQAEAATSAEAAFAPPTPQQSPQQQQATNPSGEREVQRQWIEQQLVRYEAALTEHPGWIDVRIRYGMLLKLLGRYPQAIAEFDEVTKQNPTYVEAWVQLGLTRQTAGDVDGALSALETAIQIKPEYADLHYRLGLIYCSEMEFELASERFEQALSLKGDNPDFQRQVWAILQNMQMTGRKRTSANVNERTVPLTKSEAA